MPISATHLRATVEEYLQIRPDQGEHLRPLLELLGQGVDLSRRDQWAGHVTASAIVLGPQDKVLFIHHAALRAWLPYIGGHAEPEDTCLNDVVARELREELGLTPEELTFHQRTPIVVDVGTFPARKDRGHPAHLHFDFCYLARTQRTAFTPQPDEVLATQWRDVADLADPALRHAVDATVSRLRRGLPSDADETSPPRTGA